jgi:hypothetical protein
MFVNTLVCIYIYIYESMFVFLHAYIYKKVHVCLEVHVVLGEEFE